MWPKVFIMTMCRAKALGFTTVWVNRASVLPNTGLSLPVAVTPDLVVPDMQSLVAAMGL